jgi:argininosuccinate synthase
MPGGEGISVGDKVKKVVLAYSGGLDTAVALKWIQDTYDCEVVTFTTADLGQGVEIENVRERAEKLGVKEIFIDDLREEFVRDYVFPMMRSSALYENAYLMGTSIARPLIAKRQVEIARETGSDAIAHGATGKGNDQVRFEIGYYAHMPEVKVIAPWREWDLNSREVLVEYAEKNGIEIGRNREKGSPYSCDRNLLHCSWEGGDLEDPWREPDDDTFVLVCKPEDAPDEATYVEIDYEKGDPVAVNGESLSPAKLLERLNEIAGRNAVGRRDLVENRFVGLKNRGIYETPGGTVLSIAHRDLECITLDREASHLKDELGPRYAKMVYNGFWFSPEREMLQAAIDNTQETVTGTVRLKLYKGNCVVVGRKSPHSLFDANLVTFEDDGGAYDQFDAHGFIRLNALRLRLRALKQKQSS